MAVPAAFVVQVLPVHAEGATCCVKIEQDITRGESNPGPATSIECRIAPSNGSCLSTPVDECLEWELEEGAHGSSRRVCTKKVWRYEAPLPCSSRADLCKQVPTQAVSCSAFNEGEGNEAGCKTVPNCFWIHNSCQSKLDRTLCPQLNQDDCGQSLSCAWNGTIGQCITALEQNLAADHQTPGKYAWALPPCAFEGSCRNVNDVLQVAVTYAKGIFGIIGTAGLLFFIYGGFTIVMSGGSSDKVGKGKEIIVSAIIGIIICFSAYIAVDFLLDALQVGSEFREIGTFETQQ